MPEVTAFLPWDTVDWDNVNEHSGTNLEKRPYYYKINRSAEGIKIVIISAPNRKPPLHATDFLGLNRQALKQLNEIAHTAGVI